MNIAVLVKQVPDTWSDRQLVEPAWTLDRGSADAVIDEIDTRGVEAALSLVEEHGGELTVLTMGGDPAVDVLRKALAMGAHRAVHLCDDGLAGSCALQTSAALAAAIRPLAADLVITGNESTDGGGGVLSSMLAERLGWPQLTSVRSLTVADGIARAERVNGTGFSEVSADLPAVVSVTEKINDPRYPSFKGIMAAKKKPLDVRPARLGEVRLTVESMALPPERAGGKIVGEGADAVPELVRLLRTEAKVL